MNSADATTSGMMRENEAIPARLSMR
jgi:hypothetical protein